MARDREAAAQRCLVRPSSPCRRALCPAVPDVWLVKGSGRGRDPGRECGGWTLCLGHNKVCVSKGRQEIERLNWNLASPSALRPSATLLFSFLCILEANAGQDLEKMGSVL